MSDVPRVLIAEDDESIAALLADVLTDAGHRPVVACDPASLPTEPVDLVLVDLRLDRWSGVGCADVIRRMRDLRGGSVPAIVVTADPGGIDAIPDLDALPQVAVLAKPFSLDGIEAVVAGMLALGRDGVAGLLATPTAVLIADEDARYRDANGPALALLGYDRERLLDMRVGDVLADGPETEQREWRRYVGDRSWANRIRLRRADGTLIGVEVAASVIAAEGGPLHVAWLRPVELAVSA